MGKAQNPRLEMINVLEIAQKGFQHLFSITVNKKAWEADYALRGDLHASKYNASMRWFH